MIICFLATVYLQNKIGAVSKDITPNPLRLLNFLSIKLNFHKQICYVIDRLLILRDDFNRHCITKAHHAQQASSICYRPISVMYPNFVRELRSKIYNASNISKIGDSNVFNHVYFLPINVYISSITKSLLKKFNYTLNIIEVLN